MALSGSASCAKEPLARAVHAGRRDGFPVGAHFWCQSESCTHAIAEGIAVVFRGRLDEQHALRTLLERPATEDVVALVRAAYRRWGAADFATHLYGDFSVVLWDSTARRLVLTRSPSGLYALCYRQAGAEVHFASTPQELLAENGTAMAVDEQALAEWLVLRPRTSDRTLFAGVRRVPPGASVIVEERGLTTSVYWRPEALEVLRLRDHREYAEALLASMQTAVSYRVGESQGDVAAQLSGGLDSSSVVALAAEQLAPQGRNVLAFTAVPGEIGQAPVPGRFLDESAHAATVAEGFSNVVHRSVTPGDLPLFGTLDRYSDAQAEPPLNPHHLRWVDSTYAAAARTGANVVLTGSMGNMTVSASGDYAAVEALQQRRFLHSAQLFRAWRTTGARSLRHLPGIVLTALAPWTLDAFDRVRRTRSGVQEYTGLRPRFAAEQGVDLNRWNRRIPFRTVRELTLDNPDRLDLGLINEGPRTLYSLNATDPTFDRRVVELALRIPLEQFCAGGLPRALIRTAMQGRLPDMVRLERRRGLQSADFLTMLSAERANIAAEFERMSRIDVLRRALELPAIQQRLYWPAKQAIASGFHTYSNSLMRALSVGRFIRRMEEGTLFSTALEARHRAPDAACIAM